MNIHKKVVERLIFFLVMMVSLSSLNIQAYAYSQQEASQLVTQAYCSILARKPDDGGFNNYVNLLTDGGWTAKQLISSLATSEEHKQKFFDNQTTSDYVTHVFNTLLQREPSIEAFTRWTNRVERRGWLDIIETLLAGNAYARRFGEDKIPVAENCLTAIPPIITPLPTYSAIPSLIQEGMHWTLQIPYIAYEFPFGKLVYTGELFSENNGQNFLVDYSKVTEVEEKSESTDTPKLTQEDNIWLFNFPKVHNVSTNTFESMQLCSLDGIEMQSCDCVAAALCPVLNQIPFSNAKLSSGIGYDQNRDAVKAISCFNGAVMPIDGGESVFNIDAVTSYSDVIRASQKSAGGKLGIGDYLNVGGSVQESEFYRKTKYEQLVTLNYNVILGTEKFVPDVNNLFVEAVRPYLNDPCLFKQYCGDSFVEQVQLGADLYIKMHFEFDSEFHQKIFSASAGADIKYTLTGTKCNRCTQQAEAFQLPITASISASINKLSQSVKERGSMKVYAVQKGGNVEYLASAVGSNVSACSLTDIRACTALIDKVINYAATDFAASVRNTPPKVLSYTTNSVATIPGAPFMPSELTPEVTAARGQLAGYYNDAAQSLDKVSDLLLYNLEPARAQKMQALETALKNDITQLETAISVCRTDLSQCLCKKEDAVEGLQYLTILDNPDELVLGYRDDDGLLLHLAFDGNAQDTSWNENHGQVSVGNLTYIDEGVFNGAAYFDGRTAVNIPYTEPFRFVNSSFTFSAWVDIVDNPGFYRGYISLNEGFGKRIELAKYRLNSSGTAQVYTQIAMGSPSITLGANDSGSTLQRKGWLHLVSVVNQEEGGMTLYVNGIKQSSSSYLINYNMSNPKLSIGSCVIGKYGACFHKGPMDEVKIWQRALSEKEVINLYGAGEVSMKPYEPTNTASSAPRTPGQALTMEEFMAVIKSSIEVQ